MLPSKFTQYIAVAALHLNFPFLDFPKRGIDNLFFIKASSSLKCHSLHYMTTTPLEATSFINIHSFHKGAKTGKSVLDKKEFKST
jgi:hypothetical protein